MTARDDGPGPGLAACYPRRRAEYGEHGYARSELPVRMPGRAELPPTKPGMLGKGSGERPGEPGPAARHRP
jgi:hypothetical protein